MAIPFKIKVNTIIVRIEIYLFFPNHNEIFFFTGKFVINFTNDGQMDNIKPTLIKETLNDI